jgi:hypothetical protein
VKWRSKNIAGQIMLVMKRTNDGCWLVAAEAIVD